MANPEKHTHPVSDTVFRAVYDSPASLPGHYKWVTSDEDVRQIEELLGMHRKQSAHPYGLVAIISIAPTANVRPTG